MKKIFCVIFCAAILALVSCNKEPEPAKPADKVKDAKLCVDVKSPLTKASGVSASDEAAVNGVQYLVFTASDGKIDGYAKVSPTAEEPSTSTTIACSSGEKKVYAIVNAVEDLSLIQNEKELLSKVSLLKDNAVGSFLMDGMATVTLPHNESLNIDVNRMVARVLVKKITAAFEAPALRSLDMTVDAVYLTNVVGEQTIGHTLTEYSLWYNKKAYAASEADALVYESVSGVNLKPVASQKSASTEVTHQFYAFPNASASTAEGGEWSARHTRLVIEATLGGEKVYYPITLPVLESNRSYEINELVITRRGSSDADTPVSVSDASFSVVVKDWTQVLVTGDRDSREGDYTI